MNAKVLQIVFIIIFMLVMGRLISVYYPAGKQFVVELIARMF